jgi:hypothetical protein
MSPGDPPNVGGRGSKRGRSWAIRPTGDTHATAAVISRSARNPSSGAKSNWFSRVQPTPASNSKTIGARGLNRCPSASGRCAIGALIAALRGYDISRPARPRPKSLPGELRDVASDRIERKGRTLDRGRSGRFATPRATHAGPGCPARHSPAASVRITPTAANVASGCLGARLAGRWKLKRFLDTPSEQRRALIGAESRRALELNWVAERGFTTQRADAVARQRVQHTLGGTVALARVVARSPEHRAAGGENRVRGRTGQLEAVALGHSMPAVAITDIPRRTDSPRARGPERRRGEGERCSHRLGRRCTARSHLGTP